MEKTWWKESVVYQIYPRSFCDSNGDGIGDIRGIILKLDYLKELGVDIVWLSPVYQSPNDDNGYDISDYQAIMTEFGTMEDFDELLAKAHERGLKIIMDLVVNHTSDEHRWFAESRKSKDNQYRDYYIWKEGRNGREPNNWGSWFGGSAWEYDENTDMYYLHIFSKKQPDLNWDNEKVRESVFDMMTWWLDKGIDGFRMDVISLISKVPGLPDGETNGGKYGDLAPYCAHGPHVHEYLREMNAKVLSKYDIMTVGEAACVTLEEAKKYAGADRHELDTVFQFEHVEGVGGPYGKWTDGKLPLTKLKEIFLKWDKGMEDVGWNTLFWSNHDQPRAVSRFGNDSPRYRELSAKMLAACLHMMRGTPYIYQGEELGMTNAGFAEIGQYRDVESLHAYRNLVENGPVSAEEMMRYLALVSRDNARTPMQWDDTSHAGFTTGTPWISVNSNYKEINAASQTEAETSVYSYYKKLIELRHRMEIIVYGTFDLLMPDSEEVFAYQRRYRGEVLTVLCNFTGHDVIPSEVPAGSRFLLGNYDDRKEGVLRPYEAAVYFLS